MLRGGGPLRGLTWRLQDTGDGIDHAVGGHDVGFCNGLFVDTHNIVFLGEKRQQSLTVEHAYLIHSASVDSA